MGRAGPSCRCPARANLATAVPMRVASTIWSRRPAVTGQSRSRTRICIVAITTPSAPSRLTSRSSWRLASCRDWLTSSVQPATSALPEPQRAWRAVTRSSCRDPIEMPSTSPAGTQPVMISLAKSCPDSSAVKGTGGPCAAPGARTAVPRAVNCGPPRGNDPRDSRMPTTPCPPSPAHSVIIRPTAVCRAWSMVCTSGPNDPTPPRPDTWAGPRRRTIPTPRGSYTRWRTRRCRRPRRTPGRRVRSPRCGWRRTRPWSARTPTCRWTAAPPSGPRPRRAVLRSRPQPRPPPCRDAGPEPGAGSRPPWFHNRASGRPPAGPPPPGNSGAAIHASRKPRRVRNGASGPPTTLASSVSSPQRWQSAGLRRWSCCYWLPPSCRAG